MTFCLLAHELKAQGEKKKTTFLLLFPLFDADIGRTFAMQVMTTVTAM